MGGAVHRPGAVPLRPLSLGDIYDAAFRIIRYNPGATVGSAVLVASVAMAVPVLVTAVLTSVVDLSLDQSSAEISNADAAGLGGSLAALLLGLVLQGLGLVLVTGMVAQVAAAAAVGRRLRLGEAWAATRGRRWRLVGLSLLLGTMTTLLLAAYTASWAVVVVTTDVWATVLYGVLTVPLFLALLCWFWVRVYLLPVPALMLEDVGVLGAVGRGFRLSRGQFWRLFGIAALTVVVAQVAGSVLTVPLSIAGQLGVSAAGPEHALLGLVLVQAVGTVVSSAFVAPFSAAVTSVQYLDQRIRKEAYDVELLSRAGTTPP